MSSAKSCSWYRFRILDDLQPLDHHSQEGGPLGVQDDDGEEGPEGSNMDPEDVMMELDEGQDELFHFVPNEEDNHNNMEDQIGPSTQANRMLRANALRTLDDNDDSRVVDVHPSAGYVIRMDDTLHNKWRSTFGDVDVDDDEDVEMSNDFDQVSNPYMPFASELDWRIARWAVKDGPGQNAFDRLLKIPGVCSYCLKQN